MIDVAKTFDMTRLTETEWQLFNRTLFEPTLDLGERVGRFEPPFQYLKSVIPGFSDGTRFILNKALEGDPLALQLREDRILEARSRYFGETVPADVLARNLWFRFFTEYDAEWREFLHAHYDWVRPKPRYEDWLPNPRINEILDSVFFSSMSEYGFTIQKRKYSKITWRCESRMLSHRVLIEVDKSPRGGTATFDLEIPTLGYSTPLGYAFFFSGSAFDFCRGVDVERNLSLFFAELYNIFPHVLVALEEGIKGTEKLLEQPAFAAALY